MVKKTQRSETNTTPVQPPRRSAWDWGTPLAISVLLVIGVAAVFGQTVHHEFFDFDDPAYVYANPAVQSGLTREGFVWAMTTTHASNWQPVTWLSHMLDWQLYQGWAGGHHRTSVLLHACAAVVLFLILWRMTLDLWPSAFVAAVFAVHPLRVESVAWVAERKDILGGLLFLLTIAAYLGYVRHPRSIGRYLLVVVLFALGLMAKPMLVTLPMVLLLLDYWPLGRMTGTSMPQCHWLVEKIPLFILTTISCYVTRLAQSKAIVSWESSPLMSRVGNALVCYVTYLEKFLWPTNLAVLYPHPGDTLPTWQPIAALVILLAISSVAIFYARRIPCLIVGWLWYLGMLVPVIGIVQVGAIAMADRYTYLPQIGLCIALAWGIQYATNDWKSRRFLLGVPATAAIVALAGCAWVQTGYWRDSVTLWTHTLACTTNEHTDRNVIAHTNLANELANRNQPALATEHYLKALKIRPDFADTHLNYGVLLAHQGQSQAAISHYREAQRADPTCFEARYNCAVALARQERLDEAIVEYQEAIVLNPNSADAHANLGMALQMRNQPDTAMKHFRIALDLAIRQHKQALADALRARGIRP